MFNRSNWDWKWHLAETWTKRLNECVFYELLNQILLTNMQLCFLQNFKSIHFQLQYFLLFVPFLGFSWKQQIEETNYFLLYSFRNIIKIIKGSRVCFAISFDGNLNWNSLFLVEKFSRLNTNPLVFSLYSFSCPNCHIRVFLSFLNYKSL